MRHTRDTLATARWEALGTSVVLRLTDPGALPRARELVIAELDAIDRACSRFRTDSELSRVNAHADGRPQHLEPLLADALAVALRAAALTGGAVDPTIGRALVLAGYDRDWRLLASAPNADRRATENPTAPTVHVAVHGGWQAIELDSARATIRIPRGIALDLGASAKAWAADRAARTVHALCGCGVLISLGGDIATAGRAPKEGWRLHVTDDHRAGPGAPGQAVAIVSGGLATSSTTTRRWQRGGATMHHIIDPATGTPVRGRWRTVSVAAADCTDANIASTAALVLGDTASAWLQGLGLPARMVDHRGVAFHVGAWPELGDAMVPTSREQAHRPAIGVAA